jgi:hypothetical protein
MTPMTTVNMSRCQDNAKQRASFPTLGIRRLSTVSLLWDRMVLSGQAILRSMTSFLDC